MKDAVLHYSATFCILLIVVVGSVDLTAVAEDSGFTGDWMITIVENNEERMARLELRNSDGEWVGHVEGGPITISIQGDLIDMEVDGRSYYGDPIVRPFTGRLQGDVITGRFGPKEPSESCLDAPRKCANPSASWTADRIIEAPTADSPPSPVDLSGFWAPTPDAGGLGKYSMDLTPAAQEWVDTFVRDIDMPAMRCVSAGLFRSFASAIKAIEIIHLDDRLTFISGPGEVRRIFVNGPPPSDFVLETPMGYSLAKWEGSTLVIETTLLLPSVRGLRGEPTSGDARIVERYSLSDDGNTLSGVMTLHDPEYYNKPPIKRRKWSRLGEVAIASPLSCDPDYFFRELYETGRMQEYIDREHRRF